MSGDKLPKQVYKHIYFEWKDYRNKDKKTSVYICRENSGCPLGHIEWKGTWRQYCFYPGDMTVFNSGCLEDIRDFIERLKEIHSRDKEESEINKEKE